MGGFIWDWVDQSIALDIPNKYTEINADIGKYSFVGSLTGKIIDDKSSVTGKILTGYMSIDKDLNTEANKIEDALSGKNPFTLEIIVKQNSEVKFNPLITKGDNQLVLRTTRGEELTFLYGQMASYSCCI